MGSTLTNTQPKDTYKSLLKTSDSTELSATAKYVSDGNGNDSPLALSTSAVGIGTSSPASYAGYTTLAINGTSGGVVDFLYNTVRRGSIYNTNNGDTFAIDSPTGTKVAFLVNGGERAAVTENGITFNGGTSPLDDYEEGTWTMGVSFSDATTGITYSSNTGTYTKIGRQVTVNGYIALSSKGSASGSAKITGLPFSIPNSSANFSPASVWLYEVSFANQHQAYGVKNSTTISFYEITEAGVVTPLTNANFANNTELMVSLTYFV